MTRQTHQRALDWVAHALGAVDAGRGEPFHLWAQDGRRIRVAGRHVNGRQPNYFHIARTLDGYPFDDFVVVLFHADWNVAYAYRVPFDAVLTHYKQPGVQDCRLMIRGDDSWRMDPRVERLA